MVTLFLNPAGFKVMTILPTQASFNAAWFIGGNFVSLQDYFFLGEGNLIKKVDGSYR
jgi:hypothetical protein